MSPIIKKTASARVSAFHFEELHGSVVTASDAREIIADAHAEADAIRRRAEEQGRVAALDAAERIVDERVARRALDMVSSIEAAVDRIDEARAGWLARWERMAIRLAVAIAGRVVRREIERTPEITLSLVREALQLAAGTSEIQLRLHPDDYNALGPEIERIVGELNRIGDARIVSDPSITKGGCRLDTRHGTIDQQLETQLARIEQELV